MKKSELLDAYHELLDECVKMHVEIFRIKARQREYGMHDGWCQQWNDIQHAESVFGDGPAVKIRDCNCWLVKEEND